MLKETYEITNRGKERLFIKYKNMGNENITGKICLYLWLKLTKIVIKKGYGILWLQEQIKL